ncbi:MAG: T9SS type A sorting domain-containing protein, partial [Candidatus Delongbacteria bacterium]|nr:T9SS type A sorting domain-containing protein [Candidatus Delongbacteria bacterium]
MKYIFMIIVFATSLLAQWDWSIPVQLSETSNYPDTWHYETAITIDHNNVIYVFWITNIEIEPWKWYSIIEYRKSTDGGNSWSITENLTPEYTTERIYDIRAVTDLSNNIHLFYKRSKIGTEFDNIFYKKFNSFSWTSPEMIGDYVVSTFRAGIDSENRIYLTWFGGDTTYYRYCEFIGIQQIWSDTYPIEGDFGVNSSFEFDRNNNLYCLGTHVYDIEPYLLQFNVFTKKWSADKMFEFRSSACELAISDENIIYANISVGPTNRDNISYMTSTDLYDSLWTDTISVGNNNNFSYKEMFIDSADVIHLFELHYEEKTCLSYTSNLGIWMTDIFRPNTSTHSYFNFDVVFDNIDNFYITYKEHETETFNTTIYFQTKRIDTEIINNENLIISDYELSQNYPNPFNPMTTIEFAIPQDQIVNLSIYNSKGELIDVLVDRKLQRGKHKLTYYAKNFKSGIYFYTLKTVEKKITNKM